MALFLKLGIGSVGNHNKDHQHKQNLWIRPSGNFSIPFTVQISATTPTVHVFHFKSQEEFCCIQYKTTIETSAGFRKRQGAFFTS